MDPTSQFSLDAMWEPRDFNEDEYETVLNAIANKEEGSSLMVEDNSVKVVGTITKIWQTLKGWFGFENKTDPIKVNYELLKILRYGESHHYLQSEHITPLLEKLHRTLSNEKSYEKIATIIGNVIQHKNDRELTLDNEIRTYQKLHKDQLIEPFWSRVFPRYFARIKGDEAHVQYNRGRILASNKQWDTAVTALEKAVGLHKDPEWALLLAKTYINQAKDNPGAIEAYEKALNVLGTIDKSRCGEAFLQDYRETEEKAITNQFVQLARTGNVEQAIQGIKKGCDALEISFDRFFTRSFDSMLSRNLTQVQYGRVLVALSKEEGLKGRSVEFLSKAIEPLSFAAKQKEDAEVSQELIDACVSLGNSHLEAGEVDMAEKRIEEALHYFETYKETSPAAVSDPVFSRIVTAVTILAEHLKNKKDFKSALNLLEKIEVLSEKNPLEKAKTYFSLAHLEQARGNDIQALIDAQKAYHSLINAQKTSVLNPGQYREFVDEIVERLVKSGDFRIPKQLIDEVVRAAEQFVGEAPHDPGRNFVLAKAYLSKAEQLCVEKLYSESNTIIDKVLPLLNELGKGEEHQFPLSQMMSRAHEYKFGIQVKLNEPSIALKTLKIAAQSTKRDYKTFLEDYIAEVMLATGPSQEQLGRFYQLLGEDPEYRKDARENLSVAIERYVGVLHEKFDERISEQLVISQLKVSELWMEEGNFEKAEEVLQSAKEHIGRLTEGAPSAPCLPRLRAKVLDTTKILAQRYEAAAKEALTKKNHDAEIRYLQGAIRQLQLLKVMSEDNRGEQAGYCFALAKLERQRGNFSGALMEAERAQTLDPKGEYRTFIDQMLGETETQKLLAENYFRDKVYDKALKCYLNCFKSELEKNPQRKEEIVGRMIHLADLVKENNSSLAARGYEAAEPYFETVTLAPVKKVEVYRLLAEEAEKSGDQSKAIAMYQALLKLQPDDVEVLKRLANSLKLKGEWRNAEGYFVQAIRLRPEDPSIVFALGNVYEEQRKYDKALSQYRLAYDLDPGVPQYWETLIRAHVEAGDQFFAKGDNDPQKAIDSLVKIREYFETRPELEANFHRALKGWVIETTDNRDFRALGKEIDHPRDIEVQAQRANEIINKVYDGERYHFKPELMPQELVELLQELRLQVAGLRGYYDKLRQETEELVEIARQNKITPQEMRSWQPRAPLQDLTSAKKVKEEAENTLRILDEAMKSTGVIISPELRGKSEQLKRLLKSYSMAEAALPHYLAVAEISGDQYAPYINKIIDSYILIKDYPNAIAAYDKYKQKFPQHPIHQVPRAGYLEVINGFLDRRQITEASKVIENAIKLYPDDNGLKKAQMNIHYQMAKGEISKGDKFAAFRKYQEFLSRGVELPAEVYYKLAQLYIDGIENNLNLTTKKELGRLDDRDEYLIKVVELLKKAADLEPTNAEYQYQAGKYINGYKGIITIHYDPLPYIKKAHELNMNHFDYAYANYRILFKSEVVDEAAINRAHADVVKLDPLNAPAEWPNAEDRFRVKVL